MALNQTRVQGPRRMLTDSQGRLYFFNEPPTAIFRTTLDGKTEIVVGRGPKAAQNGVMANQVQLGLLADMGIDSKDRLYFSSLAAFGLPTRLFRVETAGLLTVLAGGGNFYSAQSFLENQPASDINFQTAAPKFAVTPDGVVYFHWQSFVFELKLGSVRLVVDLDGEPWSLSIDEAGRLLIGDFFDGLRRYEDFNWPPSSPFGGYVQQAHVAADGTLFILSAPDTVVRLTTGGRLTDFFPFGSAFVFENDRVALNSGLAAPSAIATNADGDLFVADSVLDQIFVIRDAAACLMERPYIGAIVNGASFNSGDFSPGELVSIFGDYLGLDSLSYGAPELSDTGTWQDKVGGVEIFVNGYRAPIIFTRVDQAAFVIPNEVSGQAKVQIHRDGFVSGAWTRDVVKAAPGLFTVNTSGGGQVASLNEDTSLNSPNNRAAPGSVIVLYLTGGGLTNPPSVTGSLNDFPLPQLVEQVEVLINWEPAAVEFAGPAPGLISGVIQVNARIPANTPSGTDIPVVVSIGGIQSRESPSNTLSTISIQ